MIAPQQQVIPDTSAVVLTSIVLTPASASLMPGGVQTFDTYAVFSDNTTSDTVTATYSATGGTVTSGGQFTAGGNTGSFKVFAAYTGPFSSVTGVPQVFSDTSVVQVAAAPPPAGALADPTQLPTAAGQLPDTAAWRLLNIPAMPAGGSYQDPVTGVRVWKATDPSTPGNNLQGGHDYGDGGAQISREWGTGSHTLLVRCVGCALGAEVLVDFTRGSGFSNWRSLPGGAVPCGDLRFTFSNVPSTPRIAYTVNCAGVLNRIDTETNQIANIGNFPFQGDSRPWLQSDRTDTWFVKSDGADRILAWNSQTNQVMTRTAAGLDEPHFEKNGRFVAIIAASGMVIWDLETDQISQTMPRSVAPFFHVASARSGWLATNADLSAPWRLYRMDPVVGGAPSPQYISNNSFGTGFHYAGQWIQEDSELGGDLTNQWALASVYNLGPGITPIVTDPNPAPGRQDSRNFLQGAVGYTRLNASDMRVLAHTYQLWNPGDYWELPRATTSPDGKLVMFDSDMMNSGRSDLFVAEVPLR